MGSPCENPFVVSRLILAAIDETQSVATSGKIESLMLKAGTSRRGLELVDKHV